MEKVSAACAMEWSIKLEKSLRSKNPVKAVEAILDTGEKLEQWSKEPESAIAVYNLFGLVPEEDKLFSNTILLRLVDAFCVGEKLVKLAVVRVFMSMFKLSRGKNKSESATWFLSKARVCNHLEILIRVKNVYEKGDTEAKALALILFGCWRDFASEFAPVRYLIFTSMVSSHDLEVRSSLFAAACFCEVADDFALVVLGMLNDMVKFPEIMPKTRLAAVRVFAKMGCSHAIANRAFKICMKLVLDSPKEDNLIPFLVSLTKLASRSTHLASELAEVIMPFLSEDKTSHVRAAVLRCLHFLVERGMCFSLAHEREIASVSSLLKQEDLSSDMQLKALQIFQKILFYKLCMADASELHQLIAIVENASLSQIFSSCCLAISIMVDIWKEIERTAEIRSIEVSSTSLPLQLVVLIMDRVTLLGRLCSDPFQADYAVVSEIQDLLKVLHLLVGKHSELRLLVLEKVRLFLEFIVNLNDGLRKADGAHELLFGVINYEGKRGAVMRSEFLASIHKFLIVFLENLEGNDNLLSEIYEKVKHITEFVRSCSFIDFHTQMIFTLLLHSPILWGFTVNDDAGDSGVSLVADIVNYGIVSLDCSNQILMEKNYWPAYRAGVYAARLGAWVTSAMIFDQLKTNVQSDIYCCWLKSLTYLSHAEGKFQLLLTPSDSVKLVNWLKSNSYLPELSKDASGEFAHCVALHEAYMNLQSSLGMLGNIIVSREVFCFQTWLLVLKTRLLETVLELVECLGLLNQDIHNKKQVEETISTGCNSLQQLPRISIQLQKLAKEFDMLATCFIDIDDSSSSIITTFSLSCSVLAFAAGIVLFLPSFSFNEALVPFTSQSGLCSRLVQDLVQRLWKVDPEICKKLNILVKTNESLNCLHLQPRNQVLRVCGKAKMLLSICRDALSCIYGLQNQSVSMHKEEIMSEITKSCRNLLSQAIMKWMQIPFGIPKYFFNIRPCVGAEIFVLSSESSKRTPDTVSVEQGFQLSLDLCLQLKNVQQQQVPVRLNKLYCLLYTKLAYHTSTQHGETNRNQKSYSPWRDEDLVEMSNKLFHHAINSGKKPEVSGRFDWTKSGVSTVVQFEPNERGQGFSSCLLDVSRFPVGSYQIKWLSCCIDQHGSYWTLLPLNGKPVFTIKKAS
ncbi:Armadillo-type fold [Arabidopsis suecica]|uniref:Armadillo-type fold n=1 Tax=Arabidopsis suecica TaxID=45249 RepID=A0A8T1YLB6_ARASU|nr:Armadillo-type fold [Arabidopsis suecica]